MPPSHCGRIYNPGSHILRRVACECVFRASDIVLCTGYRRDVFANSRARYREIKSGYAKTIFNDLTHSKYLAMREDGGQSTSALEKVEIYLLNICTIFIRSGDGRKKDKFVLNN